ncbi:hypothetical protein LTR56_009572 [Elasticomyces elasticus]|nr:hypothetical protein LTR56_009572 [Elasticomyces elasticus]KAK3657251.1 hypothetical protein LTR22_009425 [Elasticomyces elasticus]KAK4922202.1 hypothetical protein LTR49_010423 [Elasticomyces elasticus]KAK5760859.1 hypothetical protein LTS12_009035 [Elasticomyces elasticus]
MEAPGRPGRLTLSGMLYEGNFKEWDERIACMRIIHRHATGPNHDSRFSHLQLQGDQYEQLAAMICAQVRPSLLSRVPEANRKLWNPWDPMRTPEERRMPDLMISLEIAARPFRFESLPPELRKRIYRTYFGESKCYHVDIDGGDAIGGSRRHSRLLLLSRAVREEATPIFFSETEMWFAGRRCQSVTGDDTFMERSIRRWAKDYVKENLKYLRRVRLSLWISGQLYEVTVSLGKKTGLAAVFSAGFPEERKAAWQKHILKLEANREALGLQGEAIVLAFTSKSELWEERPQEITAVRSDEADTLPRNGDVAGSSERGDKAMTSSATNTGLQS